MKKRIAFILCCGMVLSMLSGCGSKTEISGPYDYILKGGTVVDGTNSEPYVADIAVKDGKIAKIAATIDGEAETTYDVAGQIVAPGFIDIHTHSDVSPFAVASRPSKIFQGVTTELCGNCGKSMLPYTQEEYDEYMKTQSGKTDPMKTGHLSISEYAANLDKKGYYNNVGMLVGHARLRTTVMGEVDREPTEAELEQMKELLAREMERGCYGMSLGLLYPPSAFAKVPELVELSKVIAQYDGFLAVHMRNEGNDVVESLQEALEVARQSGVRLQISHLKITSTKNWGKANELLTMIEDAKKEGIDVNCDQYPFMASSTIITVLLPDWAQDGGSTAIVNNLENATDELKEEILERVIERGGPDNIYILVGKYGTEHDNKYLSDVMKEYDLSEADAVIKVVLDTKVTAHGIFFSMNEEDVTTIMKADFVCVGSDGSANDYAGTTYPHPRNFATYPQYFQTVREKDLMPIETAVYKCTGFPAEIMRLTDRGVLKEGMAADIIVFDYETIKSNSTYSDSRQRPDGIQYIFVNGALAVQDNKLISTTSGKALLYTPVKK